MSKLYNFNNGKRIALEKMLKWYEYNYNNYSLLNDYIKTMFKVKDLRTIFDNDPEDWVYNYIEYRTWGELRTLFYSLLKRNDYNLYHKFILNEFRQFYLNETNGYKVVTTTSTANHNPTLKENATYYLIDTTKDQSYVTGLVYIISTETTNFNLYRSYDSGFFIKY